MILFMLFILMPSGQSHLFNTAIIRDCFVCVDDGGIFIRYYQTRPRLNEFFCINGTSDLDENVTIFNSACVPKHCLGIAYGETKSLLLQSNLTLMGRTFKFCLPSRCDLCPADIKDSGSSLGSFSIEMLPVTLISLTLIRHGQRL